MLRPGLEGLVCSQDMMIRSPLWWLQDLEVEIFMHMLARESEASTGMEPFKAGRPVNSFAEEGDGMACASKQRSAQHMLCLWSKAHADTIWSRHGMASPALPPLAFSLFYLAWKLCSA